MSKEVVIIDYGMGNLHSVTKAIAAVGGVPIITDDKDVKPVVRVRSIDENVIFDNFLFEDMYINGIKADSFDAFDTMFENVTNINIK